MRNIHDRQLDKTKWYTTSWYWQILFGPAIALGMVGYLSERFSKSED